MAAETMGEEEDQKQILILAFKCDSCRKVFCLKHRSYKSHDCPKSDHGSKNVVVFKICLLAIEMTGCDEEDKKAMLERHKKSEDCDPKKKKKPACPVRRCKEVLTFSNMSTSKICQLKVCLKHRFPTDHACEGKLVCESW